MVNKTIRKAEANVTTIVMSMLLIIAIFIGMFLYMQQQGQVNGIVVDERYNDTYTRLLSSQSDIDTNVNAIKDNLVNISEADDIYQVAWNGLKGLGNTLKLPISFVSDGVAIFEAFSIALDPIPTWAKGLALTAIIALIVFIVLAKMKGDTQL